MAAQKEDEDRKANHTRLVAAKEEIATLTATIETKLTRQGDPQLRWRASRMTWATRRGPWPLTRSWPPSSPKVVAASHRSGRSARRAVLEKARLVNLTHLARQSLFSLRSTWECGWLLASATSSDRLSCDSHGAVCTS